MELQTGELIPWQNVISMTSLRYKYDVIVATVPYLLRHWYRRMADYVYYAPINFQ